MHQPVMLHEGSIHQFVMLSEAKHPCAGFLADARNDIFGLVMLHEGSIHQFVMLSEAKHPCAGFLADARNDIFGLVMLSEAKHPPICHAERSEASTHWIPRMRWNDKKECSE
jgi:hypothetical protein